MALPSSNATGITQVNQVANNPAPPTPRVKSAVKEALSAKMDIEAFMYGSSTPLYKVLVEVPSSMLKFLNTYDKAEAYTYFDLRDSMQIDEACFVLSKEYGSTNVAIKTEQGIMYAGLLHGANRTPLLNDIVLCGVETTRDFWLDDDADEPTIRKGVQFLKFLPREYINKLNKVA